MTLRAILAVSFLLVCGLPMLVFWLWPHSRALEAELDRAHERHVVLAQAAAETLGVYQESVKATFSAIVDSVSQGSDLSAARGILDLQAFTHFCIVDANSGAVLDAFSVSGARLPPSLPRDLFQELSTRVHNEAAPLQEVWLGQKGGPQFILVERLGDRFVFASVNGAFLQRVADSVIFGQAGHMAIIDTKGRLIAHPNPDWVANAKDLSGIEEIANALKSTNPEVIVFFSPALNENVVAGVAPVSGTDWRVLVPQPISEMKADIAAGRLSAILVFSAGLALSAVVALAAAGIITRPLKDIAEAADRMSGGEDGVSVARLPGFAPLEMQTLRNSFNDMSTRVESTLARVTMLAQSDPATELLNKRSFHQAAQSMLEERGPDCQFALLQFDLNNLKHINDAYGHPAGDDAIQSFARLLEETFPAPSLVGRVGGDEFSVITKKTDFAALRRKVSPIIEGFQLKVGPDAAGTTTVACSVGAASTCFAGADLNLLVNQADEAMYFAKKRVSGLEFYDSNMRARSNRRLELSSQLRRDVANARIKAVFQPIFDLSTSRIVAFEALARWKTPRLGEVGPDEFLPVAQDAGIICELDSVVRRQAFELCRDLRDRGSQIPVSVNVTAPDLARTDFLERFVEDLGASGLSGSDVIVEVTERIFDDRGGHTIDTLSALARLGVSVQLDDFGKGFSSHGLLPLFSFDAAKIDMHFAGDPVKDTKAAAIVISLLNLAREIGLKVVLEGIETQDQRDFATQQLPDRVQGFLMGRPVDKAKVIELVQSPNLMVAAE